MFYTWSVSSCCFHIHADQSNLSPDLTFISQAADLDTRRRLLSLVPSDFLGSLFQLLGCSSSWVRVQMKVTKKNIEMLRTPSCYKDQRANGEKGQRGWGWEHLSGPIAPTIKANIFSNSEQKGFVKILYWWLELPTGVRGLMRSKQAMKMQQKKKHFKDEKRFIFLPIFFGRVGKSQP